jgi:hypothetical protein
MGVQRRVPDQVLWQRGGLQELDCEQHPCEDQALIFGIPLVRMNPHYVLCVITCVGPIQYEYIAGLPMPHCAETATFHCHIALISRYWCNSAA